MSNHPTASVGHVIRARLSAALLSAALLFAALALPAAAWATGVVDFPPQPPASHVLDQADLLSRAAGTELDRRLQEFGGDHVDARLVTLRRLDYGLSLDALGEQLVERWSADEPDRSLLLLLIAAPFAFAASPALVSHEFIYEKASYPSCHASTIVETAQGGIVAAWFGGTAEKNPDVGIWVSRYDAAKKAWTPSVEVANGVQSDGKRHPTWNPVLFQPRGNAPLMLFYKVGPSPQTWWGELRTSIDGGRSWGAARRLPDGIYGPIKNKPVQLADGTILSPTSDETDEIGRASCRERVCLYV